MGNLAKLAKLIELSAFASEHSDKEVCLVYSNDCALRVEFGARVLQERQELFFALLTRLLLYRQVLFDRIHHVLDELEDLLLACFSGFALGTDCLGDCF